RLIAPAPRPSAAAPGRFRPFSRTRRRLMSRASRGAFAALLFVCSVLVAGCGGPPATAVSGKLLENGEPIKPIQGLPPGDKGWRLSFVQAEAGDQAAAHWAQVRDDGTFTVEGPNKKGLPPGKYRVSIQKGAMGQATNVQIADVIEIPKAASVTIEVDAGK